MNRLQFATLLSWAGEQGLEGRKRLQKVVYFLQRAGCPLECHYILHHFGPYSHDVAETCDEMVAAGLVIEDANESGEMRKYRYSLSSKTRTLLQQGSDAEISAFEGLGRQLIGEPMWHLELGSTILYFLGKRDDWDWAFQRACKYKNVNAQADASQAALTLAKSVIPQAA